MDLQPHRGGVELCQTFSYGLRGRAQKRGSRSRGQSVQNVESPRNRKSDIQVPVKKPHHKAMPSFRERNDIVSSDIRTIRQAESDDSGAEPTAEARTHWIIRIDEEK